MLRLQDRGGTADKKPSRIAAGVSKEKFILG